MSALSLPVRSLYSRGIVPLPATDALAYPDINNPPPGTTVHLRERWDGYSSVGAIASTPRADGGAPFHVSAPSLLSFVSNPDPFSGGSRCVQIDISAGGFYNPGFHIDTRAQLVNRANIRDKRVIVVAHPVRLVPGSLCFYQGKQLDFLPGGGSPPIRHDWDAREDMLGMQVGNTCDNDGLCSIGYTNGGNTPVSAQWPANSTTWCPAFASTVGSVLNRPPNDTYFPKQNMHADVFTWGRKTLPGPVNVGGTVMEDHLWRLFAWRLTKRADGMPEGCDRIEAWVWTVGDLAPTPIMRWVGDQGSGRPEEGKVFAFPGSVVPFNYDADGNEAGIDLAIYNLTATLTPVGFKAIQLGGLTIFSHDRLPLAA